LPIFDVFHLAYDGDYLKLEGFSPDENFPSGHVTNAQCDVGFKTISIFIVDLGTIIASNVTVIKSQLHYELKSTIF